MYFVRYHPLKDKLRDRTISDREALPYLIVFAALTALVGSIPLVDEFGPWDALSTVLSVVAAVVGVFYAYSQNGGNDGHDLILKYVVLGWVVAIRCLLVVIPVLIVVLVLGQMTGIVTDTTGWFDVVLILAVEVVVYQRIGRHLRDTVKSTHETSGTRTIAS